MTRFNVIAPLFSTSVFRASLVVDGVELHGIQTGLRSSVEDLVRQHLRSTAFDGYVVKLGAS